jgi:hypothetical protein
MSTPEGAEFFAQVIMACVPKSHAQAMGEVKVTRDFLKNFAGDNVRRLAKSFGVPGDHYGQMSMGHRLVAIAVDILCCKGAIRTYQSSKVALRPSCSCNPIQLSARDSGPSVDGCTLYGE